MRKIILLLITASTLTLAQAQSGNNQLGIGVEVGIPLGDFGDAANIGVGGSAKLLLGVGQSGQLTLTSGYTTFKVKDLPSGSSANLYIVPILAGYRHNFSGFYLEPQAGYGIYGSKYNVVGMNGSDSEGAFTWAIGTGYALPSGLDIGARFQSATKDGESTNLIGLSLRWNFNLSAPSPAP